MEDKEMFDITKKKTLEHSVVPRLNEHPKPTSKWRRGEPFPYAPGHRFFSGKITFLQATV